MGVLPGMIRFSCWTVPPITSPSDRDWAPQQGNVRIRGVLRNSAAFRQTGRSSRRRHSRWTFRRSTSTRARQVIGTSTRVDAPPSSGWPSGPDHPGCRYRHGRRRCGRDPHGRGPSSRSGARSPSGSRPGSGPSTPGPGRSSGAAPDPDHRHLECIRSGRATRFSPNIAAANFGTTSTDSPLRSSSGTRCCIRSVTVPPVPRNSGPGLRQASSQSPAPPPRVILLPSGEHSMHHGTTAATWAEISESRRRTWKVRSESPCASRA